jgi:hypothetical protein
LGRSTKSTAKTIKSKNKMTSKMRAEEAEVELKSLRVRVNQPPVRTAQLGLQLG